MSYEHLHQLAKAAGFSLFQTADGTNGGLWVVRPDYAGDKRYIDEDPYVAMEQALRDLREYHEVLRREAARHLPRA